MRSCLRGKYHGIKRPLATFMLQSISLFTNYFSGRELLRGRHRREKEKVAVHFLVKSEGVF